MYKLHYFLLCSFFNLEDLETKLDNYFSETNYIVFRFYHKIIIFLVRGMSVCGIAVTVVLHHGCVERIWVTVVVVVQ